MKLLLLLSALFSLSCLHAQEGEWKEPSKESSDYHEYRLGITVPPYGLAKVKGLIASIPPSDDDNKKLNRQAYNTMSFREQFTYHMIHAEAYSQNCDIMPPVQEEHKKIFGQLPDAFGDYSWSREQGRFMERNRDSVIALIKESVQRSSRMGINYKRTLVDINAREMIPFLVSIYNKDKKDHDILTVLMLLMKNNKYEPFLNSLSYRKLYGENGNYQSYIDLNKANEELIIKRATDFYQTLKK
jgi:hypothetical protein